MFGTSLYGDARHAEKTRANARIGVANTKGQHTNNLVTER
jgi:hypothetical protein